MNRILSPAEISVCRGCTQPRRKLNIDKLERIIIEEEKNFEKMMAAWDKSRKDSHDSPALDSVSQSSSSSRDEERGDNKGEKVKIEYGKKVVRPLSYGLICEVFKWGCKLPEPVTRAQSIYCARIGLAQYNEKHGTDYKLVDAEPFQSTICMDSSVGLHCNFMAAKSRKKFPHTPKSAKLFYVDFYCNHGEVRNVSCCIVNPAKAIYEWCSFCPTELAHCPCKRHRYWHYDKNEMVTGLVRNTGRRKFCAKTALAFYNKKHGTDFKLLKALSSNADRIAIRPTINRRYHCNFTASSSCDYPYPYPQLFFAEIVEYGSEIKDVDCCILNSADAMDSLLHIQKELDDHCWFCARSILHPSYFRGYDTPHPSVLCVRSSVE